MAESNGNSDFAALLQRLKAHVDHGVPLGFGDLEAAFDPGCLAYAAMAMGSLASFKHERCGGPLSPLSTRALAFARAEALALAICEGLTRRLDG
jgi:hypothetical protein